MTPLAQDLASNDLEQARNIRPISRTKVGFPGAPMGMSQLDPSVGGLLKNLGYATGQFGKNHVGDRNETLPTVNGFDEFLGNLYHLNAEEEPELPTTRKILRT